ncbi:MAG: hypothetical protein QM770_18055 [Tepidisphaeraceae bacterium]
MPPTQTFRFAAAAMAMMTLGAVTCVPAQALLVQWDSGSDSRAAARRAAVEAAQAQVNAARAKLEAASNRVRATWAANQNFIAATKELNESRQAFQAERKRVIDQLIQTNTDYRAATQAERDAAERVRLEQEKNPTTRPTTVPVDLGIPDDGIGLDVDQGDANVKGPATQPIATPEQARAAQARLDERTRLRKLEADAIAGDQAAAQAKAHYDAAGTKANELRLQLRAALLNDPEYKAAETELQAARAQVTAAAAAY